MSLACEGSEKKPVKQELWEERDEAGKTRKGMLNLTFYLYLNNKRDHTRNNRFAAFPSFYEDHFAGVYGIFCLERTVILVKEKWNQPQTSKKTTKENSKHILEGVPHESGREQMNTIQLFLSSMARKHRKWVALSIHSWRPARHTGEKNKGAREPEGTHDSSQWPTMVCIFTENPRSSITDLETEKL